MITTLSIQGFKRISAEIRLKDLTQVNYLVGKNGSGKTSVLLALANLQDQNLANGILDKGGVVHLEIDGKTLEIKKDEKKSKGALLVKAHMKRDDAWSGLSAEVSQFDFVGDLTSQNAKRKKECFELLNGTLEELGQFPLEIRPPDDAFAADPPRFTQNGKEVQLEFIAEGILALAAFKYSLIWLTKHLTSAGYVNNYDAFIVLLEEPENNLHPELQKRLPQVLDDYVARLDEPVRAKILFFVATHSPFIVGAATGRVGHKFYVLEEGRLVDIDSTSKVRSVVAESSGNTSDTAAYVVGEMLGATPTDLGYPENFCVLEEESMRVILQKAKDEGWLREKYEFVVASGANKVADLVSTVYHLEQYSTIFKCNLFYFDRYRMVTDKFPDTAAVRLDKIKAAMNRVVPDRFIELSRSSLEEYYDNLVPGSTKESKKDIEALSKDKQGKAKSEHAREIASKLKSKSDFTLLFGGELDSFLLDSDTPAS